MFLITSFFENQIEYCPDTGTLFERIKFSVFNQSEYFILILKLILNENYIWR